MIERLKKLPKKLSATGTESGPIAVCAPGPSLRETWEAASAFPVVIAVKSAHDFIIERGLIPQFAVCKDDTPHVIERAFPNGPHPDVQFIVGGRNGRAILGGMVPKFANMSHLEMYAMDVHHPRMFKIIQSRGSGGYALMSAYMMGFREIHLFGFDNCFKDGLKRANGFTAKCEPMEKIIGGKVFVMNKFLEGQYIYIRKFKASMPGVRLIPHGDGVFSHLWKQAA